MPFIKYALGDTLWDMRIARNLSQDTVAALAGLTVEDVIAAESGELKDLKKIKKIFQAFGYSEIFTQTWRSA